MRPPGTRLLLKYLSLKSTLVIIPNELICITVELKYVLREFLKKFVLATSMLVTDVGDRMLETKYVGDKFEMFPTVLVTNNCYDALFSFVQDRVVRSIPGKPIQREHYIN